MPRWDRRTRIGRDNASEMDMVGKDRWDGGEKSQIGALSRVGVMEVESMQLGRN